MLRGNRRNLWVLHADYTTEMNSGNRNVDRTGDRTIVRRQLLPDARSCLGEGSNSLTDCVVMGLPQQAFCTGLVCSSCHSSVRPDPSGCRGTAGCEERTHTA